MMQSPLTGALNQMLELRGAAQSMNYLLWGAEDSATKNTIIAIFPE